MNIRDINDYIIDNPDNKPLFAIIDWSIFKKWDGLRISADIFGNENNLKVYEKYAKEQGYKIAALFYPTHVILYVIDREKTHTGLIQPDQIKMVYDLIAEMSPDPIENSVLKRRAGLRPSVYKKIIQMLTEQGKIKSEIGSTTAKGGRPPICYFIVHDLEY